MLPSDRRFRFLHRARGANDERTLVIANRCDVIFVLRSVPRNGTWGIPLKIACAPLLSVTLAEAGIQSPDPTLSRLATERVPPFSCFVVSVATDMRDSSENIPCPISRRGDSRIAPTAIFIIRGVGGNRHEGAQRAGRNPSVCPVHRTPHEGRRLFTRCPGVGLEHIVTARGPC